MVLISSLDPFTASVLSCLSLGVARRNRKAMEAALTNGSAYLQCFVVSLLTSLTHIDTTRSFESDATALTNSDVQYVVDPEEGSTGARDGEGVAHCGRRMASPYDDTCWWDDDTTSNNPAAATAAGGTRYEVGEGPPCSPDAERAAPSFDSRQDIAGSMTSSKKRSTTIDSGGEDGDPDSVIPSTVSRINPGEVDFLRWATSVLVKHLELDIAGSQAMAQTALASMGYVALYYNTDHVVLDEMVKYGGSLSDLDCPVRLCLLSNEEMCQKHILDGWLEAEWQRWVDEEMKRYVDVLDLLWTERVKHAIVGFHGEALADKDRADKLGIAGSKSDEFPPPSQSQRDPAFVLPNPSYLKPTVNYKYQSLQYPWLLRLPWYISVKLNNESFSVGGLVSRRISVKILKQLKAYSVLSHNILEAGPLAHLVVAAPVPLEVDEDSQKNNFQVALCIGSQYCSVYGGGLVSDPEWCTIPIADMRRDALAIDGEEEAICGKYHRWQCPRSGVIVTFILGNDGKIRVRSVGFPIRFEPSSSTPISIIPPLHICRPLASTAAGVTWLRQNKLPWLIDAREHLERCLAGDAEYSDAESQSQCRVYMWMFANIGAGGELGVALMEDIGALETLVKMATECKHLCLRGSAIYALSLLCSVPSAQQPLLNLGWDPVVHGPIDIEKFLQQVDKEDEKPLDEEMSSTEEYSDLSSSSTASSSDLSVVEVDGAGPNRTTSPLFCSSDAEDEAHEASAFNTRSSPRAMRRAGSENMFDRYRHPYMNHGDASDALSASSEDDAEAASLKRLLAANPFSALSPSVHSPNEEGDADLSYTARRARQDHTNAADSSSSSSSTDSDLAKMEREPPSAVGPLPVFTSEKSRERRRGTTAPRRAFYKEYTPEHAEVLRHLTALCNTVAYKESHKFLIRKKHSEPHLFQSVGLWLRIHKRMLKLHFPLATRRVIDNLFDYVFLDFDALDYLDNLK
ncbi:hypothetical protein FOZ63_013876 [Perkinsus olseni]|nr:hypothetical protein FOZ63_013876 [Perkinsus olseni]